MRCPYRRAAVGYLLYGCVYLGGAIAALTPDRQQVFFGFVPWWAFYVLGALLVITLPVLVWRRFKWFTRILCLGPAGKALALCWKQGRAFEAGESLHLFNTGFFVVAVLAAGMLFWAGWGPQRSQPNST